MPMGVISTIMKLVILKQFSTVQWEDQRQDPPVCAGRKSSAFRSHWQRIDLSWVQPRYSEHAQPEGDEEKKEESDRGFGNLIAIVTTFGELQEHRNDEK